ncbi:nuclease SbcCD subunit D [Synergistales bacterium]|nr:nuclease SbcCD subunit D [Synergistales bacterium]GHV50125.1 nuclease SbcCD subunit D [Synergistales bacterium]
MKLLHLADLHIGKTVNGFSMIEEQRHVFRQVIGYIQKERPNAVLIAGDVYDRAVPGVEAVRVFDDFLTELSHEDVTVLLISGNHDSPERLSYASRLLSDKRIHLCGAFDGTLRTVTLTDEYGEVNFRLLPFIKPASVREMFAEREIESYGDALAAALESASIDYTARNVLVSHQFFTKAGENPVRSESELNPVGGLDAINAELVSRFDYVALGHLHGAQTVGYEHIRYAGSPIKYSFSEWRQEKSVSLAELREKGGITVTKLPLTPLRDMREIKGELDILTSEEISSQADKEDYLRVILTDEKEIIDPMGKLRGVYPNVMVLDFENSRTSIDLGTVSADSEKAGSLSPYDLFSEFFHEVSGTVMSGEQMAIVRELLEIPLGAQETEDEG